jgi:hypothetical protein
VKGQGFDLQFSAQDFDDQFPVFGVILILAEGDGGEKINESVD